MLREKRGSVKFGLILAIAVVLALSSPLWSTAEWLNTSQLTDNDYFDGYAQVSGNNVVWRGFDGNDDEIFLYNGSTITKVTDNSISDYSPQISGDNVVWVASDGNDTEIFLYNGSTITTLTDNSIYDKRPQISGNNVVWIGSDGVDDQIFLYNGSTVTTLTDNCLWDSEPQISGNNVVYEAYGDYDSEIILYNGSTATTLTDNRYGDYYPQVSGNNVVWHGYDGNDWEIFFYNGLSTIQLTYNGYDDKFPQISGNNIVWHGYDYDGGDWEIFLYNGSTVTTLTDNSYGDYYPQVSGNNVVWHGYDDGNNYQVFLYDGVSVTQLSNNNLGVEPEPKPQIDGNNVVWHGTPDGADYEIFMASLEVDVAKPSDPTISSSSHKVGRWRSDNTIDLQVHPDATDTVSGVAGYSITFSKDTTEVPPQTIRMSDTSNATDTYTSPPLANGSWYANVSTVDKAGNWTSTTHKGPFKIDTTKPTASLKINGTDVYTNSGNVTLNISANDTGGSGLYWMRVRNKGGEWSSWKDFKTTKEWALSEASIATLGGTDRTKEVELEVKDRANNHSAIVSDTISLDTQRPTTRMTTPFVSTRISKTTTFKVKWWATDASPSSGLKHYTVRYRPSTSSTWRTWKANTTAKEALFKGRAGVTYYFRTEATDNARNASTSKVYKTIVPFNEGNSLVRRIGFNGYKKLGRSQNYLTSVRYSYRRGHALIYKLYKTDGIGLVVTQRPDIGLAKIYVDGKYVKTVDAQSSKVRPRQLIFYRSLKKKGTHYLKVVNLGTPGRARFEVDGVVVSR